MAKGTIKSLVKTYGFIDQEENEEDVFFLQRWVENVPSSGLREGLRLEYETRRTEKGLQAVEGTIRVLERRAEEELYCFLNPYNFVRCLEQPRPEGHILGDCPPPPHDRYVGLTGRITCTVEAKTPLFISDSHAIQENEEDPEHRSYRFFRYGGEPALPASSLRGMVRSAFEAVTNSCFITFNQEPLSFHLPSTESPWLVPARVERDGDNWQLRLLTGATDLQTKSPDKKNPEGMQYGAWCATYWPLKPSKTLRGVDPKGRRLSRKQRESRQSFIERTRDSNSNPDGVAHGEDCYALLRPLQHPHPRIKFWDVVEIRRERSALPKPGNNERIERGWLCLTNQNVEPKHSERFLFRAQENRTGPELIDLPEKVRQAYESLIKDYQDRHRGAVQKRQRKNHPPGQPVGEDAGFSRFVYQYDERILKGGELVYVMLEGTVKSPRVRFIAPVSVPRVGYEHSVGELLPDFLHRCKNYDALCPASRVFGWVHENASNLGRDKRVAYAGRVRLSHGKPMEGTLDYKGPIPLAILSTPKPTTTPFYLLDPDSNPDTQVDYDTPNARLRGRKFYRHHGKANPDEYKGSGKSDQNRTVRDALKPGAQFTFTLEFENLAEVELGALLYALELEEGLFHRLGYAKPLGFGSVKATVDEVKTVHWPTRLRSLNTEAGWRTADRVRITELKSAFLQTMRVLYGEAFDNVLADLRALLGNPPNDLPVHYPRSNQKPDPDGKNYEWFMGNKKREQALPLAPDDIEGFQIWDKNGNEVGS
jgi:CRISPR-associated protein (TIGR03986 family)